MIDSTYEDKLYQTPKFAGVFRYNAQKNCAALSCRALRRVARMCSSNVSDPANRLRKTRKKKSSAVLLFEAVAGLWSAPDYPGARQEFKEEGKPQVSLPFCPCGGCRTLPRSAERNSFAEIQRKTPRPLGTNTPAQFVSPSIQCKKRQKNGTTNAVPFRLFIRYSVRR